MLANVVQAIDQMKEETKEFKCQLLKNKQWAIGTQMIKHKQNFKQS
jgi:hypothetical protein